MNLLMKSLGIGLLVVGGFLALKMIFSILTSLFSVALVAAILWGGWRLLNRPDSTD